MQAGICPIADQFVKAFGGGMRRVTDAELRQHFLGWQCRIRQAAQRSRGGEPPSGARPRVLERSGAEVLAAMTVLLVPKAPEESTAFLKFQVSRDHEPGVAYEAGVRYLAGGFYQEPELFSDEMTALFAPASQIAKRIAAAKSCLLDFEQERQRFTLSCRVRRLAAKDLAYQATWWHNRIFNCDLPSGATVLAFKPDWKSARADPWPGG